MNRPAYCFGLVFGLALALTACSTSDHKDAMPNAGTGSAATGGSGAVNRGSTTEGKGCNGDMECMAGLNCVISAVQDLGFKICARSCSRDKPCMDGETCQTATRDANDLYCRNAVTEAFKTCGPAETSSCAPPLDCIYGSDLTSGAIPLGNCLNYCLLPSGTAMISDPDVLAQCPAGLSCLPAIGDPDVGLCGKPAARGQPCAFETGTFCQLGDLCVVETLVGAISQSECLEECTKGGMCSDGATCLKLDPETSVCTPP